MTRQLHKLSARTVETLTAPGRHSDGGGLFLFVDKEGRRRWTFMFTRDGKRQEMGLGAAGKHAVTLAEARTKAAEARALLEAGKDPRAERDALRAQAAAEAKRKSVTFGAFAAELMDDIEHGFRNTKHRQQWRNTLKTYAAPLTEMAIDEVSTDDVLACLKPIWLEKPETASRVRGRIERVLNAAKSKGLRSGENPAQWRGHLANLLPIQRKSLRGHHEAMPFPAVPAFVADLRKRHANAALALEFTILTAARTGETLGARWSEFDLAENVWTIPANRMKAGRIHRVPLVGRVLDILGEMKKVRRSEDLGEYIFPGTKPGRPLSGMAMEMLLRRMNRDDATVHGFRSSFRDWCGECTPFPSEIAEAALAHVVGNKVEQAYRRGDALDKRRKLMEAWAGFVEHADANHVVRLVQRERA